MSGTSEFYAAVYRLTALIPRGQAATYGQLAFLAGHPRASRIVGQAMARAPEGLPCHRVVYRDGRLSPSDIFGGPGIQRFLLEQEGVPFLPDGRVDLSRCLWTAGQGKKGVSNMNVTFEIVKNSPEIRTYITQADVAAVITAIGHHDDSTAFPVNAVAAALILADKTDVRRSRVRNKDMATFDIHDRVNYSVERSEVLLDVPGRTVTLSLSINTQVCAVMDYFEIFLQRMLLCRRAAEALELKFRLEINGQILL